MADRNGETARWVPPYISFNTLTTLWQRMADGPPPRIDRTYLDTFSGAYQSQVIAALKSLGLIGDDGEVKTTLIDLATGTDSERTVLLGELVRKLYPEPVRLGTVNATQGQLEDAFRNYGVAGDTMRKAIAFYLGAAKAGNVPVSKNFRVPSVTTADGKTARRGRPPKAGRTDGEGEEIKETPPAGAPPPGLSHIDPTILGWVGRLPDVGQPWPAKRRESWFNVLKAMTDDIYGEVEEDA